MKKIILASDGTEFSEAAFDFAQQLNELEPILLTGIFIPQLSYASLWSYTNALGGPAVLPLIDQDENEAIQKNILHFENLCQRNGITYRVHKDFTDFALPEIRKESRFADLLLLSSERFYHNILGDDEIEYIVETLQKVECPVLVVPEKFQFPAKNVLAYDGGASSVYAIKQFTYLLPQLCNLETTVLTINKDEDTEMPHEPELKELLHQHFKHVNFLKLGTASRKSFSDWMQAQKNSLVVGGSFGRSTLSQMFRKSFLRDVISEHKLPVFIAHK